MVALVICKTETCFANDYHKLFTISLWLTFCSPVFDYDIDRSFLLNDHYKSLQLFTKIAKKTEYLEEN